MEDAIAVVTNEALMRLIDTWTTFAILVVVCVGLVYLHITCLKRDEKQRVESKEMADKFAETLAKNAASNVELSSAVRELSNVVRSSK